MTLHAKCYTLSPVIRDFKNAATEAVWNRRPTREFLAIAQVALRKLRMLDAAQNIADLRSPPANSLEKLRGDRASQYSIRINRQYRVCFVWREGDAYEVRDCRLPLDRGLLP